MMNLGDAMDYIPGKWNLITEQPLLKSMSNKQTKPIITTKHHWKSQFRT